MNMLDGARTNLLNLFNAVEMTEARLSNAYRDEFTDRVLIDRIKEELKVLKEEFDAAWDLWQEEMSIDRLRKMNGVY